MADLETIFKNDAGNKGGLFTRNQHFAHTLNGLDTGYSPTAEYSGPAWVALVSAHYDIQHNKNRQPTRTIHNFYRHHPAIADVEQATSVEAIESNLTLAGIVLNHAVEVGLPDELEEHVTAAIKTLGRGGNQQVQLTRHNHSLHPVIQKMAGDGFFTAPYQDMQQQLHQTAKQNGFAPLEIEVAASAQAQERIAKLPPVRDNATSPVNKDINLQAYLKETTRLKLDPEYDKRLQRFSAVSLGYGREPAKFAHKLNLLLSGENGQPRLFSNSSTDGKNHLIFDQTLLAQKLRDPQFNDAFHSAMQPEALKLLSKRNAQKNILTLREKLSQGTLVEYAKEVEKELIAARKKNAQETLELAEEKLGKDQAFIELTPNGQGLRFAMKFDDVKLANYAGKNLDIMISQNTGKDQFFQMLDGSMDGIYDVLGMPKNFTSSGLTVRENRKGGGAYIYITTPSKLRTALLNKPDLKEMLAAVMPDAALGTAAAAATLSLQQPTIDPNADIEEAIIEEEPTAALDNGDAAIEAPTEELGNESPTELPEEKIVEAPSPSASPHIGDADTILEAIKKRAQEVYQDRADTIITHLPRKETLERLFDNPTTFQITDTGIDTVLEAIDAEQQLDDLHQQHVFMQAAPHIAGVKALRTSLTMMKDLEYHKPEYIAFRDKLLRPYITPVAKGRGMDIPPILQNIAKEPALISMKRIYDELGHEEGFARYNTIIEDEANKHKAAMAEAEAAKKAAAKEAQKDEEVKNEQATQPEETASGTNIGDTTEPAANSLPSNERTTETTAENKPSAALPAKTNEAKSESEFSKTTKVLFGAIGVGGLAAAATAGEKETAEKKQKAEEQGKEFKPKKRWFARICAAVAGILALDLAIRGNDAILGPATARLLASRANTGPDFNQRS